MGTLSTPHYYGSCGHPAHHLGDLPPARLGLPQARMRHSSPLEHSPLDFYMDRRRHPRDLGCAHDQGHHLSHLSSSCAESPAFSSFLSLAQKKPAALSVRFDQTAPTTFNC